jgi:hypothetical protein
LDNESLKPVIWLRIIGSVAAFLVWTAIELKMQGNMRIVFLFFFPLYLLRWWVYRLTRPNVADLRLDEANGILTVRTLFREKTVPLKDFEIEGYQKEKNGHIQLFTGGQTISMFGTTKNRRVLSALLKAKNVNPAIDS